MDGIPSDPAPTVWIILLRGLSLCENMQVSVWGDFVVRFMGELALKEGTLAKLNNTLLGGRDFKTFRFFIGPVPVIITVGGTLKVRQAKISPELSLSHLCRYLR